MACDLLFYRLAWLKTLYYSPYVYVNGVLKNQNPIHTAVLHCREIGHTNRVPLDCYLELVLELQCASGLLEV